MAGPSLRFARAARATTAALALLAAAALPAGNARADTWVLRGARVHPVSGPAIPQGAVIVRDGAIVAVGAAGEIPVPEGAAVVEAAGLDLWPGLIDAMSHLGLHEIGSVHGTRDLTELGDINPNARAEVAVNMSSLHIPVTRSNGTLLALVAPTGGMVPGTSAVIALDGWTWEEAVRSAPAGLHVAWPAMPVGARKEPAPGEEEKKPEWEEKVARLDEMLREARAYAEAQGEDASFRGRDVRWESLAPVLAGEVPVWIHATTVPQIRAALAWTGRHGLAMVLVDGTNATGGDAWIVADEIAQRRVPVVLQTTRRPARNYEPYDTPYTEPAKLVAAGVEIAFGSWSSASARGLPQEAARAAAYGLPREAAEAALTLGAARVLGIDDRYGSLEPGKSATFILVRGDVLDTRMNVERAWIDGREIDLDDHHKNLRARWKTRPRPDAE